jgi:hypothetical protein
MKRIKTMMHFTTVALTSAMCAVLLTAPARAEECETVITALNEAVGLATKNFESTMADLKKLAGQGAADDKQKATIKNMFCSASGELLGTSRATRAVAGECGEGQKKDLASFDKSIKEMETAISGTCR